MSAAAAAWLVAAVAAQLVGITALRLSHGFRRLWPVLLTLTAIGGSVVLMAQAFAAGVSLAVGYGIWTGAGVALGALTGALLFNDRLTRTHVAGLLLVVLGIALVRSGT